MKRVSQHTIPNGLPNKPVKAKKNTSTLFTSRTFYITYACSVHR